MDIWDRLDLAILARKSVVLSPEDAEYLAAQMHPQRQLWVNIAARGYLNGWTAKQVVARNIAKAGEELAELAGCVSVGGGEGWLEALAQAGEACREAFDRREGWGEIEITNPAEARKEAADMAVVLLVFAEALSREFGLPFDLIQAAYRKSEADIRRGTRT